MTEKRDVLFCLGAFPWFGKPDTPCCRCDERATVAVVWLLRGEPIVLQVCSEHAVDAEKWLRCHALWLTGKSAIRVGEDADRPRIVPAEKHDRPAPKGLQLLFDFGEVG